ASSVKPRSLNHAGSDGGSRPNRNGSPLVASSRRNRPPRWPRAMAFGVKYEKTKVERADDQDAIARVDASTASALKYIVTPSQIVSAAFDRSRPFLTSASASASTGRSKSNAT